MEEMCRLCGVFNESENLKIRLEDYLGQIQFKHLVSYYCRYDLLENEMLPQKVCVVCSETIRNFMDFSHRTEVIQSQLNVIVEISNEEPETNISENLSVDVNQDLHRNFEASFYNDPLLIPVETPKQKKTKGRKPREDEQTNPELKRLANLFKRELEHPSDSFIQLDLPETAVTSDGEVKGSIGPVWNDFAYSCTHCKIKYESLGNLLEHFRADVPYQLLKKPWVIKCTICWSDFFRSKYMNHMREHHEHLPFTCIACSKVFKNMTYLLKHYIDVHPKTEDFMNFCVQCGEYFSDIALLKRHKLSHNKNLRKRGPKSRKQVQRQTNSADSPHDPDRLPKRKAPSQPTPDGYANSPPKKKTSLENSSEEKHKKSQTASPVTNPLDKVYAPLAIISLNDVVKQKPCPKSKKVEFTSKNESDGENSSKVDRNLKEPSEGFQQASETVNEAFAKPGPLCSKTKVMTKTRASTDSASEINSSLNSSSEAINPFHSNDQHLLRLKQARIIVDYRPYRDGYAVQRIPKGNWTFTRGTTKFVNSISSKDLSDTSISDSEFLEFGKNFMERHVD